MHTSKWSSILPSGSANMEVYIQSTQLIKHMQIHSRSVESIRLLHFIIVYLQWLLCILHTCESHNVRPLEKPMILRSATNMQIRLHGFMLRRTATAVPWGSYRHGGFSKQDLQYQHVPGIKWFKINRGSMASQNCSKILRLYSTR